MLKKSFLFILLIITSFSVTYSQDDGLYVFVTLWGGEGKRPGQFRLPQGITTDSSENVYVSDTWNNRIQKFDSSGKFLNEWGTTGSGDGQFKKPCGLAMDREGFLYGRQR